MICENEDPVSNISFVKIGESKKTTTRDRSQFFLIQSISSSQIGSDGSTMTVFHNDLVLTKRVGCYPEFIVVMNDIEVLDDEFGCAFLECFGFLFDLLRVRDDFGFLDSNEIAGRFIEC